MRQATSGDLEELLELERACFDSPWTAGAFEQEILLPQAELWLAFEGGESDQGAAPVGYINFWVAAGEVSLLNLAVHPQVRRRGLAGQLLERMESQGVARGGERVFLEVRRSNDAGLALYAREGYEQVGIRKHYYSDNREDAVVMSKPLDATPQQR